MKIEQLQSLGLEKRWPRLASLQNEIAGLEKRLQEAEVQVRQLQNQLEPARDKDLDRAAAAIRKGEAAPHGTHEDSAKRQLEAAERDRNIVGRALEIARQDLAAFLQKHRAELYQDVQQARAAIGVEVAEAAREALAAYSRHEDLFYALRGLEPPPDASDYTGPPARRSAHFLGVQTTQSGGPARGDVEGTLRYLMSLGAPASRESGATDAA